jgi:predicted component of type VI protein secretion system
VTDLDSANGTWINDAGQPLAAGERHVLAQGDRILMGAWTCLTVQGAPAAAAPAGDPDPDAES